MSDNSQMLHQWVYVVIPATIEMLPLFAAYCKSCRTYYTEYLPIPYAKYPGASNTALSAVPKYGCTLPTDGIVM